MMQFDQHKKKVKSVKYSFWIVVTLPDLTEQHFEYVGESYETYISKIREAHIQIENLYQKIERADVTEF